MKHLKHIVLLASLCCLSGMRPIPALADTALQNPCQQCKRVGILPLQYAGPSGQMTLYAQGTQDSLIHALSLVQSITLLDRSRSEALLKEQAFQQSIYVDPNTQVKLGKLLGVDVLYTGSIQEVGDRIRILITEIDVKTGQTRALAQVTGPTDSLFELQDQIAKKMLRALHVPYSELEQAEVSKDLKAPPSLEAYALFIQGYQAQRQQDEITARDFYQRALALEPGYWKVYYNRSVLNFERKDFEHALKDINTAISHNPRIYYLFKARGMVYQRLHQSDKSLQDFERALQLNALDAESYSARGRLWQERKELNKALSDYARALEIKNNDPQVLLQRGELYLSQSKAQLALQDFQLILQSQPQNHQALFFRGLSYLSLKDRPRALADLNQVIHASQEHGLVYQAYYYRGRLYYEQQQKDLAFQDWQKSCELGNRSLCDWLKTQR